MTEPAKPSGLSRLRSTRRKTVEVDSKSLVDMSPLAENDPLPLVVSPTSPDVDLVSWAAANRALLDEKLQSHGGVLFRGFGVDSVERFESFAQTQTADLFAEYGDLPTEKGGKKVYQSTPYPADKAILFHNESSHMHRWPRKQWFYCVQPAETGGETPIVDSRTIYRLLDPEVRRRFEDEELLYVRNFIPGLDVSWQDFFKTDDLEAVEEFCRTAGIEYRWVEDRLETQKRCPAVVRHPITGEKLFFNQIMLHHVSCLDEGLRASVSSVFGEGSLPRNVYYGDGTPIPDELVADIVRLYWDTCVARPWQAGDVLMVDNMLVAHARNPFGGKRKIVVAMGDMVHEREVVGERVAG